MKEIQLTQGKVALVNDEDFEYLNQWKWCAVKDNTTFYAIRKVGTHKKQRSILMHRLILGLHDSDLLPDHKDHNGLNNQRENLRIATRSQNNRNTSSRKDSSSKYLGVYWAKNDKVWRAAIRINGIKKHIGNFKNENDAAFAYNKMAIQAHGEFANLNKIAI